MWFSSSLIASSRWAEVFHVSTNPPAVGRRQAVARAGCLCGRCDRGRDLRSLLLNRFPARVVAPPSPAVMRLTAHHALRDRLSSPLPQVAVARPRRFACTWKSLMFKFLSNRAREPTPQTLARHSQMAQHEQNAQTLVFVHRRSANPLHRAPPRHPPVGSRRWHPRTSVPDSQGASSTQATDLHPTLPRHHAWCWPRHKSPEFSELTRSGRKRVRIVTTRRPTPQPTP